MRLVAMRYVTRCNFEVHDGRAKNDSGHSADLYNRTTPSPVCVQYQGRIDGAVVLVIVTVSHSDLRIILRPALASLVMRYED